MFVLVIAIKYICLLLRAFEYTVIITGTRMNTSLQRYCITQLVQILVVENDNHYQLVIVIIIS